VNDFPLLNHEPLQAIRAESIPGTSPELLVSTDFLNRERAHVDPPAIVAVSSGIVPLIVVVIPCLCAGLLGLRANKKQKSAC
jgi:hypothetical protein